MPHYGSYGSYGYGTHHIPPPHFTPFIPITPYRHNGRDMMWIWLLAGAVVLVLLLR